MYFSKLENLFKLKCAWLGNFTLRKDKLEKWNVHGQKTYFKLECAWLDKLFKLI